jgi:hypothetical protein
MSGAVVAVSPVLELLAVVVVWNGAIDETPKRGIKTATAPPLTDWVYVIETVSADPVAGDAKYHMDDWAPPPPELGLMENVFVISVAAAPLYETAVGAALADEIDPSTITKPTVPAGAV